MDPLAAGTWREQTAACASGNCPLHALRPVPRSAIGPGGGMDPAAIAAIRVKLDRIDRTPR